MDQHRAERCRSDHLSDKGAGENPGSLILCIKEGTMPDIKIGGREIPLFYSTYEMIEIEKSIGCTAFQLSEKVIGARMTDEDDPNSFEMDLLIKPENKENLGKLIRILGNAGLEEKGEEPDLTDKWVLKNMRPAMIVMYAAAVMAVVNEGNSMEAEKEHNGPRDLGLEEEQGKKSQGN